MADRGASQRWLTPQRAGVCLALKVTPRAGRSGVGGIETDADGQADLAVRVTAAPEGGKANTAVIKLLAKRWRVPASTLHVVAGAGARRKVLQIDGAPEELIGRLRTIEEGTGTQRGNGP